MYPKRERLQRLLAKRASDERGIPLQELPILPAFGAKLACITEILAGIETGNPIETQGIPRHPHADRLVGIDWSRRLRVADYFEEGIGQHEFFGATMC